MRLRVLFVDYGDGGMPMAEVVTDEYAEDCWGGRIPAWYVEQVAKIKKTLDDNATVREAFISIPDEAVRTLFASPAITGVVEPVMP